MPPLVMNEKSITSSNVTLYPSPQLSCSIQIYDLLHTAPKNFLRVYPYRFLPNHLILPPNVIRGLCPFLRQDKVGWPEPHP